MTSRIGRSGMTLIELLVVVSILGILTALTLAGVQRVRLAAARTICTNNLRQMGMGLQNVHSAQGRLPPGVSSPENRRHPYPFMTWMVHLLPYVEQDAIFQQAKTAYAQNPDFHRTPPHVARPLPMKLFSCPMDGRMSAPARFETTFNGVFEYGLTSYLAVSGYNSIRCDGLMFLDSAISLEDVRDGTSNTLLIGERPPSGDLRFGWWYAGKGQRFDGEGDAVLGVRTFCRVHYYGNACTLDPHPFGPGKISDPCSYLHFWSFHSGGANFAMADGSVRFLLYSANPLMPALASRSGGEPATVRE